MTFTTIVFFIIFYITVVNSFRPSRLHAARTPFVRFAKSTVYETSLGAPGERPTNGEYITDGGIKVTTNVNNLEHISKKIDNLVELLDDNKGD